MSTTTQPAKPKRRWYQFSLRTLLIVMLVSCFVFAWIGSRMKQARENRDRVASVEEAVAAIEEAGGKVTAEYAGLRPPTWLEQLFDDPGGADDPVGVLSVSVVDITDDRVTDADLEHLKWLTTLRDLKIGQDQYAFHTGPPGGFHAREKVTDAGLVHLKALTNLEHLYLAQTRVTDAGLVHLTGLTNLTYLDLSETNITDTGLKHLKGLTELQILFLAFTKVTDAGLEHLKGLANLQELWLVETKITDQGVKKLQQALPNCKIYR